MALSGSFNTTAYSNRYLTFSWTATQSKEDNTSTISWTLKGAGSQTQYFKSGNFKAVIAGETVYSSSTRIELDNGTLVASGKKTINHNSKGEASFTASAEAGIYQVAVNCKGSGTWTLDTIPRAATITAAPNFNDEENPTITYSNPLGNSVGTLQACISFDGSNPDIAYRNISKTGTSYTFTLTDAEKKVLRAGTTGSNSRTVYFYIKTVIGSDTFLKHSGAKTFTIINGNPTLAPTVVDTNPTTYALTGDSNVLVKYFSNAIATANAVAVKESSITAYSITNNGVSATTKSAVFNKVESNSFDFSITDNRKNTVKKTITKTLVPYVKLTCSFATSIALDTETTSKATITISGNCFKGSFGAKSNALTVYYRYKEEGGTYGDWISLTPTQSDNNTYSFTTSVYGLDYQKAYTFEAKASDSLMKDISTEPQTISTIPVFEWGKDVFVHNTDVYIKGNPIADFVIERGDNGSYAYRKWNSGVMEAWRSSYSTVSVNATSAYGSMYYADLSVATTGGASQFVDVDSIQITINKRGAIGLWYPVIKSYTTNNGVVTVNYSAVNPQSITALICPMVYIIGRWK
jgi:hypothetical protein